MTHRTFALAICIVLVCVLGEPGPRTEAQEPSTAYNLLVTREQAEGLITAWNEQLPYVPGELLVKFRPGSNSGTQTHALSVLRRGSPCDLSILAQAGGQQAVV